MKEYFEIFITRMIKELKQDSNFTGLAIAGSWLRDEIDEFSDLDLILVYEDDVRPRVLLNMRSIAEKLGILVSSFTGEHVGDPALLICLYEDPLVHVDLKFVAKSAFEQRRTDPHIAWQRDSSISDIISSTSPTPSAPKPQWIEDRFWIWVHNCTLKLGRRELFELVSSLSFLREQVLGPMALYSAGFPPHGVRRIEQYLPDFVVQLSETVPIYELNSCHAALSATIEIYKDLRSNFQDGLVQNIRAEAESMRYLEHVSRHSGITTESDRYKSDH